MKAHDEIAPAINLAPRTSSLIGHEFQPLIELVEIATPVDHAQSKSMSARIQPDQRVYRADAKNQFAYRA